MGRMVRILILSALFMAGCGTGAVSAQSDVVAPAPASSATMDAAAFEALYYARADSTRMRFTGADVHFFRMMIPHHGQALEMSALAADRSSNPSILSLSARITGGQEEEIRRMRQWLNSRGLSEAVGDAAHTMPTAMPDGPSVTSADPVHAGHDMSSHDMSAMQPAEHPMPGLLTPEQMAELRGATGAEFDRLYLSYMIYHHRGAIQMVDELFSTDGAGNEEEVFRLAAEIRVDQGAEIARMERMLSILTAQIGFP